MKSRLFAALFALAVVPFLSTAQEKKDVPAATDNPFKSVERGDAATYAVTTKIGTLSMTGTMTQTVTAKTDKEVTLSIDGSVNGTPAAAIPAQLMTIDLTKPYDPTKGAPIPGLDATVKKDKSGTEKVKVTIKEGTSSAPKEFDCTWETYKMTAKAQGVPFEATLKVWLAKDAKFGTVKLELTSDVGGNKIDMTMELSELKKVNLDAKKDGN